jgi:regulation of enolase protein 1 (concanavalin A-like superfamily)
VDRFKKALRIANRFDHKIEVWFAIVPVPAHATFGMTARQDMQDHRVGFEVKIKKIIEWGFRELNGV